MQKITFFLFTQDKSSQLIFAQNLDDKHGNPQCENHIRTDNNPREPLIKLQERSARDFVPN